MHNIPNNFPISIFEDSEEKISDTLTKKRCAIFYKGLNRNGGFITSEFADKLLKTIAYAPVKGIYEKDNGDFTDHGEERDKGRIYGVVPEDHHFAWEKRMDPDGVEREYACVDVYLYTAIYEEANQIDGKGQSMELYTPSIKGSWEEVNGQYAYKYSDAAFLGLQVLGDNVEPCFEGAGFFSLSESQIAELFTALQNKIKEFSIGGSQVENEVTLSAKVMEVLGAEYSLIKEDADHVIVCNSNVFYKVNFSVDEEGNVTVADKDTFEVLEPIFVSTEDATKIKATCKEKKKTVCELIDECVSNAAALEVSNSALVQKDETISTLSLDNENLRNSINEKDEQISAFNLKVADLESFKAKIELDEKQAVLAKFSKKVDADTINSYREKLSDFTAEGLEKELAYEMVKADESLFTVQEGAGYIPQEHQVSDVEALLNSYKKN